MDSLGVVSASSQYNPTITLKPRGRPSAKSRGSRSTARRHGPRRGEAFIFHPDGNLIVEVVVLVADLRAVYALLTVSFIALVTARVFEVDPRSDRYVFSLVVLLVLAALAIGTNATITIGESQGSISLAGFALAALSGVAFGLLPRTLVGAQRLDSAAMLAVSFGISALAHVVLIWLTSEQLVLSSAVFTQPRASGAYVMWTLLNGVGCTYAAYAFTAWAKRRGVTDSTMAVSYQLEPAVAIGIAAPLVGDPLTLNILLCSGLAFMALLLFWLHEAGHTAHATADEAMEETLRMLEEYRKLIEDKLAITDNVYNRYAYDAEKREAVELWERRLQQIVA